MDSGGGGGIEQLLDEDRMRRTLLYVQELLVSGQYEALEKLTRGVRLSAAVIKEAIEEWPEKGEEWPEKGEAHHFIMPPPQPLCKMVMEGGLDPIPGVEPEEWMMEMYLWTTEQGQSDLSARLIIVDVPGDLYRVALYDILVM